MLGIQVYWLPAASLVGIDIGSTLPDPRQKLARLLQSFSTTPIVQAGSNLKPSAKIANIGKVVMEEAVVIHPTSRE